MVLTTDNFAEAFLPPPRALQDPEPVEDSAYATRQQVRTTTEGTANRTCTVCPHEKRVSKAQSIRVS